MNDAVWLVLMGGTMLFGVLALVAGNAPLAGVAFVVSVTCWTQVLGGDGGTGDPTERSDQEGVCANCGRMVPVGKDRCDRCSVVGHWRK